MKRRVTMKKVVTKTAKKVAPVPYGKPFGIGAHGPEVLYACTMLQKKGSTIKLTDKFHIGMRSAVICFQKKNKLKVTGVIDKKTWDRLVK